MMASSTSKTIADRKGRQFKWCEHNGHGFFEVFSKLMVPEGWEAKLKKIKSLDIRDDDILICTFPKSGTHWIWEIVSMVMSGKAEYETRKKEALMIEFQPSESVSSLPSPRILNTHLSASCLPEQIVNKNTKIIHVLRNPKDCVTSYYHHSVPFNNIFPGEKPFETFSEFIPYFTGEYGVYMFVSMWRYIKEMDSFIKAHPGQVLTLRFEDMKENPMDAVMKVAEFLNKDLSKDVIKKIVENCSFDKLKAASAKLKNDVKFGGKEETSETDKEKNGQPNIYRKGIVGDWKNHFTVAESERFDQMMEEQLKDCDLKFRHEDI